MDSQRIESEFHCALCTAPIALSPGALPGMIETIPFPTTFVRGEVKINTVGGPWWAVCLPCVTFISEGREEDHVIHVQAILTTRKPDQMKDGWPKVKAFIRIWWRHRRLVLMNPEQRRLATAAYAARN